MVIMILALLVLLLSRNATHLSTAEDEGGEVDPIRSAIQERSGNFTWFWQLTYPLLSIDPSGEPYFPSSSLTGHRSPYWRFHRRNVEGLRPKVWQISTPPTPPPAQAEAKAEV